MSTRKKRNFASAEAAWVITAGDGSGNGWNGSNDDNLLWGLGSEEEDVAVQTILPYSDCDASIYDIPSSDFEWKSDNNNCANTDCIIVFYSTKDLKME